MTQSFLPTKGRQSMCPSACLHAPRLVHAPVRTLLHPGSDRVHRAANIRCRRYRVLLLDQIAIVSSWPSLQGGSSASRFRISVGSGRHGGSPRLPWSWPGWSPGSVRPPERLPSSKHS